MPTLKKDNQADPYYDGNEYLLLRAGSAESADPRSVSPYYWLNLDLEALKQLPGIVSRAPI